jgi:lipopolysaccharide transport system permease protein
VPNFVKKVRFPLPLLPCVVVSSAVTLAALNTLTLICGVIFLWRDITVTVMLLPLLFVPLSLLAIGIGLFLSALGVFFRDLSQVTPLVAQLLMFLAPVCYPKSMIPARFYHAVAWNPLTWFVTAFRDLALDGRVISISDWAMQTAIWFIFALLGLVFFNRTRRMFADLL